VTGQVRQIPLVAPRAALLTALLAARTAAAQTPPAPGPPAPTLADIKDEKLLVEVLAQITRDPAIRVPDPAMRTAAQALMIEGVKHLQARSYEQALANFLEAYAKFPSPKILLNIGSTLRDMGRLSDAANTYQRYLEDPATGSERVSEVTELLVKLDEQLTTLDVHVTPRGSDVSIDGGPYIPVGQRLVTRVRPGLHLVRIRKADRSAELTVNGFEGETKRVDARVELEAPAPSPAPGPASGPPPPAPTPPEALPERVSPWLTNGTQYTVDSATGRVRRTRTGFGGTEIAPISPLFDMDTEGELRLQYPEKMRISSGAIGLLRIDGKLRGVAAGFGIAVARGRFEGDLMILRSAVTGAYLGARVRILSGFFRPYIAGGVPGFLYEDLESTKVAFGVRVAGGLELMINEHLSVQGDFGYEHFFGVEETMFESDVFVPTLGVIGRL
jgi:hypothetical protein